MRITAAVLPEARAAIEVRVVELVAPGHGEVLVSTTHQPRLREAAGPLDLVHTGQAVRAVPRLN